MRRDNLPSFRGLNGAPVLEFVSFGVVRMLSRLESLFRLAGLLVYDGGRISVFPFQGEGQNSLTGLFLFHFLWDMA